ncbi:ATP-binding protein [Peribacillus frigoritolerans]|uniref:ATP-binding protein n=1 Tax=Peribacillus frigoritolerans TaxID=450367 RepID=UPI0022320585|nr:ATP-binding protein [Peribacillus frigoritolerans]UZD48706.1 ATP-binding protein [Peribacillus frigoritolerans]
MSKENNVEESIPSAAPLVGSLRSIGYDLETAIADIIDNSIDACCKKVDIKMTWNEEGSYIRIEDDGSGMDEEQLKKAMRLGSKNPQMIRDKKVLGRFGMGLKTASFSLGKRLTVLTKTLGKKAVRCWDLEYIENKNEWKIFLEPRDEKSIERLGTINSESGTVVLIENLDRVVSNSFSIKKQKSFFYKISKVRSHLGMVFHRYFSSIDKKLYIVLNGEKVEGWDPFYQKSFATQIRPVDEYLIHNSPVSVRINILPHHSKLSETEYEYAGGPKGWNAQQGFYIYRNKRMLISGGWLGLFPRQDSANLARIEIDIQNDADVEWGIDIKKSKATPPLEIQDILKKVGIEARRLSHEVYYRRTVTGVGGKANPSLIHDEYLWEQVSKKSGIHFRINKKYSVLEEIKEELDEHLKAKLDYYLLLLEEDSPGNLYAYPTKNTEEYAMLDDENQQRILMIVRVFKESTGSDLEAIIQHILSFETFSSFSPTQIRQLITTNWEGKFQ